MLGLNSLICDKHGAALEYIDHQKKGASTTLLDSIVGTTAKAAAVRRVFCIQPASTYVRKITLVKNNIMGEQPEELLAALKPDGMVIYGSGEKSDATAIGQAEQWLMLKFSERAIYKANDIYTLGEDAGFSSETLKKAKQHLGIEASQEGIGKHWNWTCTTFLNVPQSPSTQNLSLSGKT